MAQPDLQGPLSQQRVELSPVDTHRAGRAGGGSARSAGTPPGSSAGFSRGMAITRLVQTSGLLGKLTAAAVLSKAASGAVLSRERPQPVRSLAHREGPEDDSSEGQMGPSGLGRCLAGPCLLHHFLACRFSFSKNHFLSDICLRVSETAQLC